MAELKGQAIIGAIVAEGVYVLDAPAHFGGGETDETDMAVLRHPAEDNAASGKPFIPGASIAGAARAALNSRILGWSGYRKPVTESEENGAVFRAEPAVVRWLFGHDYQSALVVDDAELQGPETESMLRDGVAIDAKSGVAIPNHRYDMEVLPPGTKFLVRFELILRAEHEVSPGLEALRETFWTLLAEFSGTDWPLRLGARTRRGYGKGRVKAWKTREVDFTKAEDVAWWLLSNRSPSETMDLSAKTLLPDGRRWMRVDAHFRVNSSMLIRSYPQNPKDADMTPVRSATRKGKSRPAIPGPSFAGIYRHRALRIAKTLASGNKEVRPLIEGLFGPDPDSLRGRQRSQDRGNPTGQLDSRVIFDEALITGGVEEVQSRIHIDPFTGGVHQGPFDEQAVWSGTNPAEVRLEMRLPDPEEAEIGLLMAVLKDLWLEDLPVGGGSSIGRGVLKGYSATIDIRGGDPAWGSFTFKRAGESTEIEGLQTEQADHLNACMGKLWERVGREKWQKQE